MAGIVRPLSIYAEIQYEGESDAQYRKRARAIVEANRRADEIEKAWEPGPLPDLRKGWDCRCAWDHAPCSHQYCPRAEID